MVDPKAAYYEHWRIGNSMESYWTPFKSIGWLMTF
jgi:hypothetical protein